MKLIRIGYLGSLKIKKASDYLVSKYMPGFDYYEFCHEGHIKHWSKFVIKSLNCFDDEKIIFALDDYLLSGPLDMEIYEKLLKEMTFCAKLCHARQDENDEYPITTQYCIWDREVLIELLSQVNTPWEFEGLKRQGVVFGNALPYNTNSCLSARWEGVDLKGLSEKDKREVEKLL